MLDDLSRTRIFLTGFSGSGKSTLAPFLASRLDWPCLDMDSELEQRNGISCSEMIQTCGLAYFRTKEKALLLGILGKKHPYVVALGGGTVTIDGIIPLLRKSGLVVWLQVKLQDILDRLRQKKDRPLLQGKTDEDLARFLNERETFYRQAAHMTIPLSGLSLEAAADKLCRTVLSTLG